MIKAELKEMRKIRSQLTSEKRRQQALNVLFDSGKPTEIKWLKMSNAIPANHDFKTARPTFGSPCKKLRNKSRGRNNILSGLSLNTPRN